MLKVPRIVKAMGELEDALIMEAAEGSGRRKHRWQPMAAAACLCLLIGGVGLLWFGGGSSGEGAENHSDGSRPYMYYAGPVLPLTAEGGGEGLRVHRHIDYDFSPYQPTQQGAYPKWSEEAIVTDRYQVVNETDKEQKRTFYYPFVGTMREWEQHPAVTVDAAAVQTTLRPGPYPAGIPDQPPLDRFSAYETLLRDGGYLKAAVEPVPQVDVPAVVYRLNDYQYTEDTEAVNPTLMMEFTVDPQKTKVFSYGMNIGSWESETGRCGRGVSSIQKKNNSGREPEPAYVILVGEDLAHYTVQGYRDGGCEPGEELEDLGCTVTRYETTLSEAVRPLLEEYMKRGLNLRWDAENDASGMPPRELYHGLAAQLLCVNGAVSAFPTDRYDMGMLEHLFSAAITQERVLYQSWEMTIPAGGEAVIEVRQRKQASKDYTGGHKHRNGYDLAVTLGSSLEFSEQWASVSGYDSIRLVSQNFGFDPAHGITKVKLDLNTPHYWMEIEPISEKKK